MLLLPFLFSIIMLPFNALIFVFTKLPKPVAVIALVSAAILIGLLATSTCNFWQTSTP